MSKGLGKSRDKFAALSRENEELKLELKKATQRIALWEKAFSIVLQELVPKKLTILLGIGWPRF